MISRNFFPKILTTRISPSGQLRNQLKQVKHLVSENPNSSFAKEILHEFKLKYWFGSRYSNYNLIFNIALKKLPIIKENNIIRIGNYEFIDDEAVLQEYADIFLSDISSTSLTSDLDERIAIKILSMLAPEGPYEFENVHLKKDDVVIDAGANMGIFSLFCLMKDVEKIYAFEPQQIAIDILKKNIKLNNASKIINIVPLGLNDKTEILDLVRPQNIHVAASVIINHPGLTECQKIEMIDLDTWVSNNNITKIDFIKADIEGAERKMLLGSKNVLKDFSPRLAICTYHFPDDPKAIQSIILDSNPKYIIKHTSHKLFAYVP